MKPDFDAIKRTTDIVRVIENYGVALKKTGQDHVGLCPFHEDKKPSLQVSASKGLWHCMACGAAGNVIQFVARKEGIAEREAALKLLGTMPGVTTANKLPRPQPSPPPAAQIDEATRAKLLGRVANFYARTLAKDRAGLDYLKTRCLDDAAALDTFQVGYCNGSMRKALPREGKVIEQLKAIGVLNEKGNEVFYRRIVVPIYGSGPDGRGGDVASLYGRRIDEGEPAHLLIKGERRGVFNSVAVKSHQSLILVESIFDALSLWIAGFHNVIALRGKDGWREEHAELIRTNGVTELYLALDNDAAGMAAADSLASEVAGLGVAVHCIAWPEGVKDANAFFSSRVRAGRAVTEDFAALLKAANPPAEPEQRLEKEAVESTVDGFAVNYGEGSEARRYQLCGVEKPNASRLKATIKAISQPSSRFVIDTVDLYSIRSRRGFMSEAARFFRQTVEVIEADVNRLTVAAENYIAQNIAGAMPTVAAVTDAEMAEGSKLGRSADLIGQVQRDLDRLGIIGERTNRLLLYLAMTSRKMEDPLAVQILSSSGAGKSYLQDAVLSLCPDEDLIKLTSLTDRALFYKGEDSLRHKAIAIAEVAGAEGARYALRNLISDKKLSIESTVKNPVTGRLETQVNTVHGPTAVFETTTNPDTDPETKSRYLLLSVDESPEQTRAIMEAQRQRHTLEGMRSRHERKAVVERHHAFQRSLRELAVVNPFEPLLGYGGEGGSLPLRRDHPKYLNLIAVVTFLHQHQRAVKHDEVTGIEFVESTLDDVAIANQLALESFSQSLDELSSPSRKLLRLVADYASQRARAEGKDQPEAVAWTRRELREAIQWTEARLRAHLEELVRLEYLAASGGRWGKAFTYRLAISPEEIAAGRMAMAIKDAETLRHEAGLAGIGGGHCPSGPDFAGKNGHFADASQAEIREVKKVENHDKHRANGRHGPNFAGVGGKRIYVLRKNGGSNGSEISIEEARK
jgi:DNA primase catalytic core